MCNDVGLKGPCDDTGFLLQGKLSIHPVLFKWNIIKQGRFSSIAAKQSKRDTLSAIIRFEFFCEAVSEADYRKQVQLIPELCRSRTCFGRSCPASPANIKRNWDGKCKELHGAIPKCMLACSLTPIRTRTEQAWSRVPGSTALFNTQGSTLCRRVKGASKFDSWTPQPWYVAQRGMGNCSH